MTCRVTVQTHTHTHTLEVTTLSISYYPDCEADSEIRGSQLRGWMKTWRLSDHLRSLSEGRRRRRVKVNYRRGEEETMDETMGVDTDWKTQKRDNKEKWERIWRQQIRGQEEEALSLESRREGRKKTDVWEKRHQREKTDFDSLPDLSTKTSVRCSCVAVWMIMGGVLWLAGVAVCVESVQVDELKQDAPWCQMCTDLWIALNIKRYTCILKL